MSNQAPVSAPAPATAKTRTSRDAFAQIGLGGVDFTRELRERLALGVRICREKPTPAFMEETTTREHSWYDLLCVISDAEREVERATEVLRLANNWYKAFEAAENAQKAVRAAQAAYEAEAGAERQQP